MKKRARPTTKAEESPEFIEFWNVWRPTMNKNDGRGAARDEFLRHVEEYGADPQDIVDGAKYAIYTGVNQGEYRVHASTWLNRRPYEDGAEMWREYQRRLQEKTQSTNIVQMREPQGDTLFLRRYRESNGSA